jgi:hypothetical protein
MGYQKRRNQKAEKAFFSAFSWPKGGKVFSHSAFGSSTPKMNIGHAGSAVAAVLAALKSPPEKKKFRYYLSSGWARDNYSISLK